VGVTDTCDGRAVVLVDLWNRGVLDVVLANQKGPVLLYKNTVAKENDWIQFELEGTRSNRSAIGAQVKLFWNGQVQVQEVSGGAGASITAFSPRCSSPASWRSATSSTGSSRATGAPPRPSSRPSRSSWSSAAG